MEPTIKALMEQTIKALIDKFRMPYTVQHVPANKKAIFVGQAGSVFYMSKMFV